MQGDLESVQLKSGYFHAFVELHIEQGPLLERANVPLGIVESIAAPASYQLVAEGAGGHAGGVLMPDRKDALCASAATASTESSCAGVHEGTWPMGSSVAGLTTSITP